MDVATGIGFTAGILTTIAFLPQLQRTWTTRSAEDISLAMLLTFTTGVLLWFVYGVLLHAWPIILTNLVTFLLTAAILILKLRYRS
jgi:MtN3 and saliva related transmembrane protein